MSVRISVWKCIYNKKTKGTTAKSSTSLWIIFNTFAACSNISASIHLTCLAKSRWTEKVLVFPGNPELCLVKHQWLQTVQQKDPYVTPRTRDGCNMVAQSQYAVSGYSLTRLSIIAGKLTATFLRKSKSAVHVLDPGRTALINTLPILLGIWYIH